MKSSLTHALCILGLSIVLPGQCAPHMGGPPGPPPPPNPPVDGPAPGTPTSSSPSAPSPAGPATPGPAGPSSPQPSNPTTQKGGPVSGPITPRGATGPRTGGRGVALTFERQHTSNERLRIDWEHPTPPQHTEGTAAAGPIPAADAMALMWDPGDERPLLVLRECMECAGTDNALLNRSLSNDRTLLLTKWFRMVRLPAHVSNPGHPLYNVFYSVHVNKGLPHFFLLAHPGAKAIVFDGAQTQTDLWKAMFEVLDQRYAKDARRAVKDWLQLLDQFDGVDGKRLALQEQLDAVRAEDGPNSPKAKKLTDSLARNAEEREELLAREAKIRDLGLLKMPQLAAASAAVK
ncbi:MAG TPA: hypothetical protein VFZ65_12065 [Planctomycetota bacterium]|nr:hypothetical protein [Planctomycetota bacterium]